MAKAEATVEELVSKIERGELRLPEMQRRYVWQSSRVRDLTQVGRLDVTPEELAGRNLRSALFKTMFLAFQAANARDWHSNLVIALSHVGNAHQLQFHHIFPKAVLKSTATTRETDDIANLAFIRGKANRKISAKEPALYFPEVRKANGEQPFESQCIPTVSDLLTVEHYKGFLAARRRLIAERLNKFLSTSEEA